MNINAKMITKDTRIIFGGVPKETPKGPVVNVRQGPNIPIIRYIDTF